MSRIWNSRKRVEVALAHREPDRIPLDLTITKVPYLRLREYLGLPPDTEVRGDRFGEVQPALDLLETLGIDITFVKLRGPANWTPPASEDEGLILDEWGVGRKRVELPDGSTLLEVTFSPLQNKHPDEIDLDEISWPDPDDPGRIAGLAEEARRLYEETDLALMGRFGGTIMEQASFLRGYTQWLIDLKMHPEFASRLMNRIADIQIALDEIGIRAAGRYLTIFKLSGEDLGMQDRPMFSPQMWQEILRPILRRRWQAARRALDQHGASHVKLMLHSDGAIRPFIPDLIEDGIEILDPVQIQCPGMEPDKLKRDFGAQLTFHGAIESQHVLPFGTVADVEAEVIRCLHSLGPGGGFIMAPVHNVQPDVPPENLVALFQAARKYGRYPL
jgi:uroporphyrinogen decarboxylase